MDVQHLHTGRFIRGEVFSDERIDPFVHVGGQGIHVHRIDPGEVQAHARGAVQTARTAEVERSHVQHTAWPYVEISVAFADAELHLQCSFRFAYQAGLSGVVQDATRDQLGAQCEEVAVPVERDHIIAEATCRDMDGEGATKKYGRCEKREGEEQRSHRVVREMSIGTNAETSALLASSSRTMVLLMCACSEAEGRKIVSTPAIWRFINAMLRS